MSGESENQNSNQPIDVAATARADGVDDSILANSTVKSLGKQRDQAIVHEPKKAGRMPTIVVVENMSGPAIPEVGCRYQRVAADFEINCLNGLDHHFRRSR